MHEKELKRTLLEIRIPSAAAHWAASMPIGPAPKI